MLNLVNTEKPAFNLTNTHFSLAIFISQTKEIQLCCFLLISAQYLIF